MAVKHWNMRERLIIFRLVLTTVSCASALRAVSVVICVHNVLSQLNVYKSLYELISLSADNRLRVKYISGISSRSIHPISFGIWLTSRVAKSHKCYCHKLQKTKQSANAHTSSSYMIYISTYPGTT
jgi:hypothetical protein